MLHKKVAKSHSESEVDHQLPFSAGLVAFKSFMDVFGFKDKHLTINQKVFPAGIL